MTGVLHIEHNSLYDDGALRLSLGITSETLAQARRRRQLRFVRKGKRIRYLGQWILDWVQSESPADEVQ
jgi:hypothetical protein